MARKRKQSTPYIMRGAARPSVARQTVLDPPDGRMPPNPVRKLAPEQLRAIGTAKVDPRLRAVHRILRRWAITHGDGETLPLMARSDSLVPVSSDAPSPLDDQDSIIVDRVYQSAPGYAKRLIKLKFRQQLGISEIQQELAIKRRQSVNEEVEKMLWFFLGALRSAGLSVHSYDDVGEV